MEGTIGEVKVFAGNFAPRTWALCEGQLLPINQNQALFSILGTTYGGDGRTVFGLPDCRGRAVIGAGNGPGLSDRRLGGKGGAEYTILNVTQIPSHTHGATGTVAPAASSSTGNSPFPANNYPAVQPPPNFAYGTAADTTMAGSGVTVTVQNSGGGQSHDNMPPWIAMNWIICLQGVFPSRS